MRKYMRHLNQNNDNSHYTDTYDTICVESSIDG